MPEIVSPDSRIPIIDKDGTMQDQFHTWVEQVTQLDLIIGTGSPEGVIEATVGRLFMDSTGAPGAVLYAKRDADVAGDRTKGWYLV